MEQPPGFVAQGESKLMCRLQKSLYYLKESPRTQFGRFSSIVLEFGLTRSEADHSVFYHSQFSRHILLVVYVDDIILIGDDHVGITELKIHLHQQFQTKDLGPLKYLLDIKAARSKQVIYISQRTYALDMLEKTWLLGCKLTDTPMDPNIRLLLRQGESLSNLDCQLVGKLNYLTITHPNISFFVSVVSQFLDTPCDNHCDAVIRNIQYIKATFG